MIRGTGQFQGIIMIFSAMLNKTRESPNPVLWYSTSAQEFVPEIIMRDLEGTNVADGYGH
jgi:hypothetical protein